tara:strand:- start:662 stop:3376 length:2715 start_codon:yes stop_codon:yes gene_type:complete
MGKALAAVGTAIVIGGAVLATGGLALIPAVAGGGLAGALGTAAFGLTAGQWITAGLAISSIGSALSAKGGGGSSVNPTDWVAGLDEGIPFAFGRVGCAGRLVYASDGYGPDNRYTSLVSVLSGAGPIQGFVSFSSNDVVTSFDPTTGIATSGNHAGAMWLQRKVGTQPDTALASPAGLDGGATVPLWGSTYKLSGKACSMQTLYENSKLSEFQGNEEKPLHIINGKYGWDPRLDSTWPGGSGSCRLLVPSTWVPITEGCMAGLNWSIGMWEGDSGGGLYGVPYACTQVGGIGSSLDGIDVAGFIAAANIADANGWTMAGWPDTKMDESVVLDMMLAASGAMRSRLTGRISCVSRASAQASLYTLTAADTAGPIELSLGPPRGERKNTVTASYWSEAHGWQMTPIEAVTNATWVTEDSGIKRAGALAFNYVPDPDQAAQLAYLVLADRREPASGTVTLKSHMRKILPGDCFTFAEPDFRLDGVKVRCLKRRYDPGTGLVKVTFRQETDAKYAAAGVVTGTPATPPTPPTPPSVVVAPPTGFGSSVSGNDVTLTWTNGATNFLNTVVYMSATNSFATAAEIATLGGAAGASKSYTFQPGPGVWYIWIASRNVSFDVSATAGPQTATVVGVVSPGTIDASDIVVRPTGTGSIVYTGAADATNDDTVSALVSDLGDGTVKPLEAANLTDEGALAKSDLLEADVQGTFRGAFAGDTAANDGGLKDGDSYLDTSINPPGLKFKNGGTIIEAGNASGPVTRVYQTTIAVAGLTKYAEVDLSNLQPRTFVTPMMSMVIEASPTSTRRAAAGSATGAWEIRERDFGGSDVVIHSGTWNALADPSSPYEVLSFVVDGIGLANGHPYYFSQLGARYVTGATARRVWSLWLSNTGTQAIRYAGLELQISLERSPPA